MVISILRSRSDQLAMPSLDAQRGVAMANRRKTSAKRASISAISDLQAVILDEADPIAEITRHSFQYYPRRISNPKSKSHIAGSRGY
jgi:hypothetical protein